MIKGILFVLLLSGNEKEYSPTERYNDSLLIYSTYQNEISTLKKFKETDRSKWYSLEANNDQLTACARLRLKKYNHQDYKPTTVYDRVGYGVARAYPKPTTTTFAAPQAFAKTDDAKYRYVVYDKQTRFMQLKNSALRIPYILKMVYDKGRLLLTEKLNPVTMQKLFAGTEPEMADVGVE